MNRFPSIPFTPLSRYQCILKQNRYTINTFDQLLQWIFYGLLLHFPPWAKDISLTVLQVLFYVKIFFFVISHWYSLLTGPYNHANNASTPQI